MDGSDFDQSSGSGVLRGAAAGGDHAKLHSSHMLEAHPLRVLLHNEIHARPSDRLEAPLILTQLAWLGESAGSVRVPLMELLKSHHLPVRAEGSNHLSVEIAGLRLRWEQRTEFETCTAWRTLQSETVTEAFDRPALRDVSQNWLRSLPSDWLVGLHVVVVESDAPGGRRRAEPLIREALLQEHRLGSRVMEGAELHTDLHLHAGGCSRFVLETRGLPARRLGRSVKRVLDAGTYRMMALLGLPVARQVGSALLHAERDLAAVAQRVRSARREHEPELLLQFTRLAGEVESLYAGTHARFSANSAYFELLQQRLDELKKTRLKDFQTLKALMHRRLTPTMQTCAWASRRQPALSERISRTSNLLRTRVEV